MRSKLWFVIGAMIALMLFQSGCGNGNPNCPTCGTTTGGQYSIVDTMAVPEHNPTGEPGGPFNSFDISWVDPVNHRFYISDRVGLDVPVFDTINDVALFAIGGDNSVVTGSPLQFTPSPCVPTIPFTNTVGGFPTRFGCRTAGFAGKIPGFGASGDFGGFPGAQCCASRGNGVNPLSCPCGEQVTADGKTLFVGNSNSAVEVFDLTTSPPRMIANIPTGNSADWDSPNGGVQPCITSANGRAFNDPSCGDLRADELSYDERDKILLVDNGDPGVPFVTLIDMSGVVARTDNCLPDNPSAPYGPPQGNPLGTFNAPTHCIIGQIWYDGAPTNSTGGCPVSSNSWSPQLPPPLGGQPVPAGIPGVPCVHAPIAPAGLGGSAWDPATGHFFTTLPNNQGDPHFGEVEEIDPLAFRAARSPIVRTILINDCMPGSIAFGPGNDMLVGCADHDGMAFPPNEFIVDKTTGQIITQITNVGGVDEIWFNPGDNRYYLAARDMPGGGQMGVIDAGSRTWLVNVNTGSNAHSISADPGNNKVFVPLQAGAGCKDISANGCVAVYEQQ